MSNICISNWNRQVGKTAKLKSSVLERIVKSWLSPYPKHITIAVITSSRYLQKELIKYFSELGLSDMIKVINGNALITSMLMNCDSIFIDEPFLLDESIQSKIIKFAKLHQIPVYGWGTLQTQPKETFDKYIKDIHD